jgi:exodeoxyribonuclease VII large subunit
VSLAARQRPDLQQRAERLQRSSLGPLALARARLAAQADRLQALDPRAVLQRGFVWVEDGAGRPVLSVAALAPDDRVRAVWADGAAQARIESIDRDADPAARPDAGPRRP